MRTVSIATLSIVSLSLLFVAAQGTPANAGPGFFNKDGYYFCTSGNQDDCNSHKNQVMAECGAQGGNAQACRNQKTTGGSSSGAVAGGSPVATVAAPQQDKRVFDPPGSGKPGYFNSDGYFVCQGSEDQCQQYKQQVIDNCSASGAQDQTKCRLESTHNRVQSLADKYGTGALVKGRPSTTKVEDIAAPASAQQAPAATTAAPKTKVKQKPQAQPSSAGQAPAASSAPAPASSSAPAGSVASPAPAPSSGSPSGGSSGGSTASSRPGTTNSYTANNGVTYTWSNPKVQTIQVDDNGKLVCFDRYSSKVSCD